MRVDLVLVGFGNVARRFVRLLDEQRERCAPSTISSAASSASRRAATAPSIDADGIDGRAAVDSSNPVARLDRTDTAHRRAAVRTERSG